MGPGTETNLLVVLAVLALLATLVWVLKTPLKRLYRYLLLWAERDKREEEQARRDAALRSKAEQEVREYLHEAAGSEKEQAVQKAEQQQ